MKLNNLTEENLLLIPSDLVYIAMYIKLQDIIHWNYLHLFYIIWDVHNNVHVGKIVKIKKKFFFFSINYLLKCFWIELKKIVLNMISLKSDLWRG